jgi:chemotaxis protein histidine kinase CheA
MLGVLERCSYLRQEVDKLRGGQVPDLVQLRQEIHKCRGSGGFYGFGQLSATSARAEDQLVLVLDGEAERNDAQLSDLIDLVITAAEAGAREIGL